MNRINVILICITAVAIFYILKQQQEGVDLTPYLNQIEALEKKVDSLHTKNTTLEKEADSLLVRMTNYDKKIQRLNYSINVIKKETKAKLDSIDKFGDDELERFFAERYYSKTDSIN
jgi:peptidoglycan hydrolase CwlO-like protein